ncbi:MAG TPA: ribonuclease H [Candidatus Binataceae bacterium]|nr:ribonuclease H [Candidatus Binataceae bacterium]
MPQRSEIHYVYADGSCLGNPGPGGWAAVIVKPSGVSRTIYGGDPATTNNRMELTGAIEGLRMIPTGTRVVLRSDSQYVVKTMNLKWKRKQNVDLWEKLDAEISQRQVKFEWVEGHAGDPLNEEADRHARAAATTAAKTGRVHYHGLSIVEEPRKGDTPASSSVASKPAAIHQTKPLTLAVPPADPAIIADELAPLLRASETILDCVECGRQFVSSRRNGTPGYCSLIGCQLKARRAAHPQTSLFKS